MAVANDTIHLAYYSNSGGLYYAKINTTGSGTSLRPNITKNGNIVSNVTPIKVDTFLSAGTKIMINVRQYNGNYVPYISYGHSSFSGTRNAIRVAWQTNFSVIPPVGTNDAYNSTDSSDRFIGNWEVMNVPVSGIPNIDDFVCSGVPTSATWTAPGGTLNYNSNLNQTIIVGYLTDQSYEGAILKGNILTVPGILDKMPTP
jgi:hypothetical protein